MTKWKAEQKLQSLKEPLNVYNTALETCSSPGMAITGFSRDGTCSHHTGDAGSHHICVNNIDGKESDKSFCEITKQPDWCRQKDACHEDPTSKCDRKKWCVCEWAFDSFVEEQGCNAFSIDCNATNKLALQHYETAGNTNALECIKRQCNLSDA